MTIKFTKSMFSWLCLAILMVIGGLAQAQSSSIVISSGAAAGTYSCANTTWSPDFMTLAGDLILAEDGSGENTACMPVTNDVTGKIALIDRGTCAFATKGVNAESAGAIGAIICNNVGGIPFLLRGDVSVTIPVLMLDSTNCANIKVAMMSETVSITMNGPEAGETCITAIDVTDGTHTAVMPTSGYGGTIFGADKAAWYSYTAPQDGLLTISSCGGGADTRLIGAFAADCIGASVAIGANQFFASVNDCDDGAGNILASTITLIVSAGDGVKFLWDDAESSDGFDFTIGTVDFPAVDVTFNVDMSLETVDPAGVNIELNGVVQPMTDNMNGIYSYTMAANTADIFNYTFWNGAVQEDVSMLAACGDGSTRMTQVLTTASELILQASCFGSCGLCPLPPSMGCVNPDPNVVLCEDLDTYTTGADLGEVSSVFTSWSGTAGAADQAEVSDVQALSAPNAAHISAANGDDAILLIGERTGGVYQLSWQMFVPSGASAYWNIQKISSGFGPPAGFNFQSSLGADGAGTTETNGVTLTPYTYPFSSWFSTTLLFDIDNNLTSLWVSGDSITSWPVTNTITPGAGDDLQVAAINFFGNTGNDYYLDDIVLREIIPAGNNCASATDINDLFGADVGAAQTSSLQNNYNNTTTADDPTTGWDCFGEPDGSGTAPSLETTMWYSFVGDGATYSITSTECSATDFIDDGDTQMALFTGDCGNLTGAVCNEDATGVDPNGPYPAEIMFVAEEGVTYWLMIDAFNFNGAIADGEFCIQVTKTSEPTVMVTFNVDLELEPTIDAALISIDGAAGVVMNLGSGTSYSLSIPLAVGSTVEYQFENGAGNPEGMVVGPCANAAGNREITIGDVDMMIDEVCFGHCVNCISVGIDVATLANGIGIFPNPTSESVNIQYDFNETIELDVSIMNTLGQVVKQFPSSTVDHGLMNVNIKELSAGVYFINFQHEDIKTTRRLIVE